MFKKVKKKDKASIEFVLFKNISYDVKTFKHENIPGNAKLFKN